MTDVKSLVTENLDIWTSAIQRKNGVGRGSSSKIDLYGIMKLRELIMGLALRGTLIDKRSSLSKSINVEIDTFRKKYYGAINKKLKESKYSKPLLDEFKIPSGWMWKRIGELCDLQTGATPSRLKPEYFSGEIKWLVSGDINQGVIYDCEGRITEEGLLNSNCKILPTNTVLIALNGQGKTRASVALLKTPAACNQSLIGMIPFSDSIIDPSFLLLALKYRYYEIREITGEKQRRGLNMGLVSELSVPLPPLSDQHRIVEKVDELMVLCDELEQQTESSINTHRILVESLLNTLTQSQDSEELEQNWDRIAEHFDSLFTTEESVNLLKQAILQLAVMGKLVPQDPEDEPASVLLEKIAVEKKRLTKEGKIKNQKALPPIREDEMPFELPEGWVWSRLNNVIDVRDGTHDSPKDAEGDETYPLITSKNFKEGKIDFVNARQISKQDHLEISKRSFVEVDDILFSMIGGNIGNQVIVKDSRPFSVKNVALFKYYNKRLSFPHFIKIYTEELALNLQSNAIGGAQPFVSLSKLRNLVIALPPIEEQHRIVIKVNELMTHCNDLKSRIINIQETQLSLADAIAARAIE